jgi:hypothetical protein
MSQDSGTVCPRPDVSTAGAAAPLRARLHVDLMCLSPAGGHSGAAYKLVFDARHWPVVEYVPIAGRAEMPVQSPEQRRPPVLVTDAGEAALGLREITDWLYASPSPRH